MRDLQALERAGDYTALIHTLKERLAGDPRILTDPYVKEWCGRRWRNLFVTEVGAARKAPDSAREGRDPRVRDSRPDRRKITRRFIKGSETILGEWQLDLPEAEIGRVNKATLIFCPGMLNGLLPVRAFHAAFMAIQQKYQIRIIRADLHPLRGCEDNAEILRDAIEHGTGLDAEGNRISAKDAQPPSDAWLICYSKGLPDALTMLAKYPEVRRRVRCVFSWAGAAGGSYIADETYEKLEALGHVTGVASDVRLPRALFRGTTKRAMARVTDADIPGTIRDITTTRRAKFLLEQGESLDRQSIPFFQITGATRLCKVPVFQILDYLKLRRHDPVNDMQLTQSQARIPLPMATDLGTLNGHHWDLSYGAFPLIMRLLSPNLGHTFPKEAAATAMFKFAAELGLIN